MKIFKDILTYAFRGSGKYVWFTCVVLAVIAELVSFAPVIGWIASLLVSGYFCAIYFQMVQSTATGGKEAPDFPETANLLEDVIWPMLQIFIVVLVSLAPLLVYQIAVDEVDQKGRWIFGLLGFGLVYLPMALLAVVVLGHLGAMGPHIVIPAIFRGGWLYWVGVLLLVGLYLVEGFLTKLSAGNPIVGTLLMSGVGAYVLMTNARMLGVVYREREEELGWL
jgi:hypothetical protein